jgi:hypothetical protein
MTFLVINLVAQGASDRHCVHRLSAASWDAPENQWFAAGRCLWDTGLVRRVEAEALVGASRDEVWQLYDDIEGTPLWVPFVRDILYVSGPARVGTVYRERTRLMGVPGTQQWEIVEHRRMSRQVHLSEGFGIETALVITFEGRGTGTWVHEAAELRSRLWGPFGWLHEWLMSIPAAWGVSAAVAGAKRAFEGDPPR